MPRNKKLDIDVNKVMDVAKPGKTAPDASGRPLIVGHQPMVKDPMMSNPTAPADDLVQKEDQKSMTSHTGLTIQPGSSSDATPDSKDQTETTPEVGDKLPPESKPADAPILPDSFIQDNSSPKDEIPQKDTKENKPVVQESREPEQEAPDKPKVEEVPKPAETQPEDKEETDDSSAEPSGDDAAAVDAVASEAGAKKQPTGPTDEEKAKQTALDNAIASKQYFVPISRAKSRGVSHMITVALVVALLLAIAVELAIDSGVLNVNVPPVVDLIK